MILDDDNSIRSRRIILGFLLLSFAVPRANAQRERVQVDWNGKRGDKETVNTSLPHPLQYYLTPSAERDASNSLCLGCDAEVGNEKIGLNDFSVKTTQQLIGEVFDRKIVQILLSFSDSPARQQRIRKEAAREHSNEDISNASFTDRVEWKSIVMQTSDRNYRELYFLVDDGAWRRPLSRAHLITITGTQVLANRDPWSALGGTGCTEAYWTLEPTGPHLVDFTAVKNEIARLTPPNALALQTGCWALSMDHLEVRSPIQSKKAECNACGFLGTVVVHFTLSGHFAIPVSSSFRREEQDR